MSIICFIFILLFYIKLHNSRSSHRCFVNGEDMLKSSEKGFNLNGFLLKIV